MRKFYKSICSTLTLLTFSLGFVAYGQITTYPHTEGFDAATLPAGWTNEHVAGTTDWATVTANGNSSITPRTGARMAEFRIDNTSDATKLVSPQLDLTSVVNPQLRFYYANVNWFGDIDDLNVYYKTSAGGTWVQLGTTITTEHTSWTELILSLPSASNDYYIAFEGLSDWARGFNIDDVTIEAAPTCPVPTSLASSNLTLNSVDVSWMAGSTETDWNIEWGAPGFTPGTGAEIGSDVVSTTPTVTINGLTASTTYHIYVQADCGGDESSWAGPFVVYTGYCAVSTTNTGDYTSAFSTTNAVTNVTYSATAQPSGSYANQTSQSFIAIPNSIINFSHSYVGGSNGINIWVDWNNNLIFDAGENVFTLANTSATKTGTITVPLGTPAGTYRLRVRSDYGSTANPGACGNVSYGTTIDYTLTIIDQPVSPTPTQEAGIPNCTDGTDLTVSGTPGTNETWYWQTTATGTSTANNASTPWTVTENGTYYVRTYNSVYNLWSTASSVVVSNVPTAPAPPTPVAAQNPACTPGTEISVATAPAGIEYYWQGTSNSSSSTTNNASSPYAVTATGTYYVKAYEAATGCWSDPEGVLVTVDNIIPPVPSATPNQFDFCSGVTSAEISAVGYNTAPASLSTTQAGGNGCTNGNMFNITTNTNAINITGFDVTPYASGTQNVVVYYKSGSYVGSETNVGAWTLVGTYSINGTVGTPLLVDVADFVIPASSVYGIYVNYNAQYTDGSNTYSNSDMTVSTGAGFCTAFSGPINGRTFNGVVRYDGVTQTPVNWYDASTAGNLLGNGSPLETIGTSVIPSAVSGTYEFYATSVQGGCESQRVLITVNMNDVNVGLTTVDASCNNGNDGSFAIANVECGVAPFVFSVDGGAFGPIPSNLTVGSHTVVVRDANADLSATYTIVIGGPAGPSDVEATSVLNDEVVIVWNSSGSETEWNIEWGLPGFTPGTGTEIGSDISQDTTFTITGLDGSTEYDIYVSANCGAGTTTGDWDSVNVTTDCDPIAALNFCENFEDLTELECWKAIDANNDGETWQVYIDEDYANSGEQFVAIYTDGASGANDDYFILPRMTLTGNEVLSFAYRAMDSGEPNDYRILLSTTDANPASFTTIVYEDTVSNETYENATVNLSAYTGDVYIAFHVPAGGLDGWYLFIDDVCIDLCTPNPGTDGTLSVCRTQGTVDLNTVITSEYTHGTWSYAPLSGVVNGSTMNVSALADGTYPVNYIVNAACTSDTTVATITIVSPASAGNNGLLSVCKNQMIDLFGALSGNVDFGGTWYNPNGTAMASSYFQTGTLAGQSIYKYIVSNGVCGADTAEVTVDISNCNFLGLDDLTLLDNVSIAPNPNKGQFQIIGIPGADFTFEVLDLNGRVVRSSAKITSSITNVNLTDVENGVYMVRIIGNDAERMMRVIKQ